MQHRVYAILVEQDDIAWKTILFDLIKKEEMDPWDIDISKLTKQYIDALKEMKGQDLKLSGKVLLAAAILLRIKSKRLVGEDLHEFDRLLSSTEDYTQDSELAEGIGALDDGTTIVSGVDGREEQPVLIPHTPLPRKRKVSVYDLVNALEKALEVKHRRLVKKSLPEIHLPRTEENFDITLVMKRLFVRIKEFFLFSRGKKLFMDMLFHSPETRKEKIRDFIATLHLATMQKVILNQPAPFGPIEIKINPNAPQDEKQKTLADTAHNV